VSFDRTKERLQILISAHEIVGRRRPQDERLRPLDPTGYREAT
jgi:hypothetical protein